MASNSVLKQLAHNEKGERLKAFSTIRRWIKRRKNVDELEMQKLWKAFFYCLWMTPKRDAQAELATRCGDLMNILSQEKAMLYLKSFYVIILREWVGLDQHRIDKFYTLCRQMIKSSFLYLASKQWNKELCQQFSDMLNEGPFSYEKHEIGIAMHIIDCYLPELSKVFQERNMESSEFFQSFSILMNPSFGLMVDPNSDPRIVQRVFEGFFVPLANHLPTPVEDETEEEEEEVAPLFALLAVHRTSIGQKFDALAANNDVSNSIRNELYEMSEMFGI